MKLFRDYEITAYYVSAFGEIWSLNKKTGRWRELKLRKNRHGYLEFGCWQNGVRKDIYVHRAVWIAFHGPIPQGLEINHLNCQRDDNRLDNLELVTRSGNQLHPPTRKHKREAMRWKMRAVLDVTTGVTYESTNEAARQTGLKKGNISACCNGRRHHTGGHIFRYAPPVRDAKPHDTQDLPDEWYEQMELSAVQYYSDQFSK